MSGQDEQYSARRPRLDPVGCVGILLLCFALVAGVRSLITGLQIQRVATPTPFVLAAATPNLSTRTATPTTPPPSPEPLPSQTSERAVTVIRVTATPSSVPPTADIPTHTPVPSTLNASPTALVAYVISQTPIREQLIPDTGPIESPTPTPLPTPVGPDNGIGIPILMYHYTSEPPEDADKYRTDLSVSPTNLRRQLEYLQAHGYTTIDFYDLARALANRQTLPEKPIILTFDDGYRDNYQNAFPLLQAFGMKAVFFIITEPINFGDPNYMTWDMVREMADAGMSMEIHTVSHPNLADLQEDKAREQILGAQEQIAAETGVWPRFISYPGGDYDEDTIQIARELDLWGAVTTRYGTFHLRENRYEWKRVRMRYTTSINEFAALLTVYVPEE